MRLAAPYHRRLADSMRGQLEATSSQGKDGQPGIGPSVRGMFSDLKRTMERVGEPTDQTAWRHL